MPALLVTVRAPLCVVREFELYLTKMVQVAPTASVADALQVPPRRANPVPVTAMLDTTRGAVPVLRRVTRPVVPLRMVSDLVVRLASALATGGAGALMSDAIAMGVLSADSLPAPSKAVTWYLCSPPLAGSSMSGTVMVAVGVGGLGTVCAGTVAPSR